VQFQLRQGGRRLGLEWLFRLVAEPRRLYGAILSNLVPIKVVLAERFKRHHLATIRECFVVFRDSLKLMQPNE